MVRIKVRRRLQLACRHESEHASSIVAAVRSGEISPQRQVQTTWLQRHASASPARRRIPTGAARRRYRRDRCPPPQSLAVGAKHKTEPSDLPAGYNARHRATQTQSPNRKVRMLLSARTWTRESKLRRGRIAAPLLDMGSAPLDYSAYASQMYASWQVRGRSEPRYKGYSRAAARGRPKHIDECRRLNPVAFVGIENATEQTGRDRRRLRASEILPSRRARGWLGRMQRQQQPEE